MVTAYERSQRPGESLSHRAHRYAVENAEEFARRQDEDELLNARAGFIACEDCHPNGVEHCEPCRADGPIRSACGVWYEPNAKRPHDTHVCVLSTDHAGPHRCGLCTYEWASS